MGRRDRRSAAVSPRMSKTAELRSEQPDALRAALAELTPEQRLMCIWKKAGFSEIEIANHLGCPEGRVASHVSRASAALRLAVQAPPRPRSAGRET